VLWCGQKNARRWGWRAIRSEEANPTAILALELRWCPTRASSERQTGLIDRLSVPQPSAGRTACRVYQLTASGLSEPALQLAAACLVRLLAACVPDADHVPGRRAVALDAHAEHYRVQDLQVLAGEEPLYALAWWDLARCAMKVLAHLYGLHSHNGHGFGV